MFVAAMPIAPELFLGNEISLCWKETDEKKALIFIHACAHEGGGPIIISPNMCHHHLMLLE